MRLDDDIVAVSLSNVSTGIASNNTPGVQTGERHAT
jgi:hypothetical protein